MTAFVGECLGRRKTVAIGAVIMVIGAILQATSYSRAQMIVARVVSGFGMGFINSTVPVIQAEFSPKSSRGIYVCAQLSTLNFGIFLVYWINYGFSTHLGSYAWRVPVILQCVVILPMFFILWIIPETPRWLAAHDRPDECRTLFSQSIGFDAHMSALMSGFLQTWFFVASFIPWFLIDRIGRRPLLLSMISLMAGVMIVQTALIYQVENATAIAHTAGIGAAAMLFIFQGAFTVGFQATVWVYPSEILPLRLRQRGSSISTASNWIFNYVRAVFPVLSLHSSTNSC